MDAHCLRRRNMQAERRQRKRKEAALKNLSRPALRAAAELLGGSWIKCELRLQRT